MFHNAAFTTFQQCLFTFKLVLNATKTKWMLFLKSSNFAVTPTILILNGNNIEMVSSYRYFCFISDICLVRLQPFF